MSHTRTATFRPGDPVCDALFAGPKGLGFRDKEYREGPIEVLPGLMSNDYRFLLFKDKVATKLTERCPATVDEWGRVSGNGIRSNFYGICHVNGYPMLPATFPMSDNRYLREKEGLSNDFVKPWHKVTLHALARLFASNLEPVPLKLRKNSSSMAPFFETRMPYKQDLCRHALKTGQKSAKLMMAGKYEQAWLENQCGGAYGTVYRRQSTDAIKVEKGVRIAKERKVADEEFALTGGRSGSYAPASKSLDGVDFKVPPGFFRERNRTAMGGPLGLNALLMPIAQSMRASIYDAYSYTLHHTTRESMQTDLRGWKFAIAADVSNHDQFWMTKALEVITEGFADAGLQDWWLKLYNVKSHLPLYVTDVAPGLGNILIGDWRSPDLHVGLPSGNAFTDLEGTILMVFVYFLIQVEHTYPQLIPQLQTVSSAMRVLDQYLRGLLPIRLKDKSDDALLGWSDPRLVPAAKILQQKMKDGELINPYMKVSYEDGGAFLGNILLYPADGNFEGVVLIGNGVSLAQNQLTSEYSVNSKVKDRSKVKRPFPGLAWETLPMVYGSAPAYGIIMDTIEECYFDVYHESYRKYRQDMLEYDKKALQQFVNQMNVQLSANELTAIDREVLADPDKLQYKWLPSDVTPGVEELLFQGLPLAEVEPFFRSAYNG